MNPPCPACGEPLYGWLQTGRASAPADQLVLQRCEACGLGIVADTGPERVVAALRGGATRTAAGTLELRAANRRSLQAGLGAGHWAALEPLERRLYLTPRSLALLAPKAGLAVAGLRCARWGRAQRWMWQTLINSFTFHDNFAREVRAGRLRFGGGRGRLAFAIDALVTILASPIVALVAMPLELGGALVGRGGELIATLRPTDAGEAARP